MAHNPLLGSRISLISKKNIRYEGTLYSINEANATVALQNVRSYGTEGREKVDPSSTFVPPQDSVHPYLLFRGCDIKDLHVHENPQPPPQPQPPTDPAIVSSGAPPDMSQQPQAQQAAPQQLQQQAQQQQPQQNAQQEQEPAQQQQAQAQAHQHSAQQQRHTQQQNSVQQNQQQQQAQQEPSRKESQQQTRAGSTGSAQESATTNENRNENKKENIEENHKPAISDSGRNENEAPRGQRNQGGRGGGNTNRRRKSNPAHQIGTGACLLNVKARGAVGGGKTETPSDDFDFESNLKQFEKEDSDEDAGDTVENTGGTAAYEKDDFFDSISCDALDRQAGIDNRLRGAAERSLNTETFGAVALSSQRRNRRYRGGGGGGRGRGRGGRGRGRGQRQGQGAGRGRGRWRRDTENGETNRPRYSS